MKKLMGGLVGKPTEKLMAGAWESSWENLYKSS